MPRIPAPPKGSGVSGRALWRAILGDFDLEEHEKALAKEACRCVDRLDRLHDAAASGSPLIENTRGELVPHPALVEARQQQIVLSRLLASLRMPTGEQSDGELIRPQRRGAARGAYRPSPRRPS